MAAVAIFDSHQPWGEGIGLQFEAKASVIGLKDSLKIILLYAFRKYPYVNPKHNVVNDTKKFINNFLVKQELYRFYKITPTKVWLNNPNLKTDARVEVKL
jgi:hypothetical protein